MKTTQLTTYVRTPIKKILLNFRREAICKNYYWKNIVKDIDKFIKKCPDCKNMSSKFCKNTFPEQANNESESFLKESKGYHELADTFVKECIFLPKLLNIFLEMLGPFNQTVKGNQYLMLGTIEGKEYAEVNICQQRPVLFDFVSFIYKCFILKHGHYINIVIMKSCYNDEKFFEEFKNKFKRTNFKVGNGAFPLFIKNPQEYYNTKLQELIKKCINNFKEPFEYNWDNLILQIVFLYNIFLMDDSPYYKTYNELPYFPYKENEKTNIFEWTVKRLSENM